MRLWIVLVLPCRVTSAANFWATWRCRRLTVCWRGYRRCQQGAPPSTCFRSVYSATQMNHLALTDVLWELFRHGASRVIVPMTCVMCCQLCQHDSSSQCDTSVFMWRQSYRHVIVSPWHQSCRSDTSRVDVTSVMSMWYQSCWRVTSCVKVTSVGRSDTSCITAASVL